MVGLGKFLVLLGLGSFGLHYMGMEFKLLMWVDNWGTDTGNLIRLGAAAVGAALYIIGLKLSGASNQAQSFDDIQEKTA